MQAAIDVKRRENLRQYADCLQNADKHGMQEYEDKWRCQTCEKARQRGGCNCRRMRYMDQMIVLENSLWCQHCVPMRQAVNLLMQKQELTICMNETCLRCEGNHEVW